MKTSLSALAVFTSFVFSHSALSASFEHLSSHDRSLSSSRSFNNEIMEDELIESESVYIGGSGNNLSFGLNNTVGSGGHLYVDSDGRVENTMVNWEGTLYIQNGGKSEGSILNSGVEHVNLNGYSDGTIINNKSVQFVQTGGIAINANVNEGGAQYINDGGIARDTVVNDGGIQWLYQTEDAMSSGFASNTKVYGSGMQRVENGSFAVDVELNDDAIQLVDGESSVENVTLNDRALSSIAAGGKILGETHVNDVGQLWLTTSSNDTQTYAENVLLNGANTSLIIAANNSDTDSVLVDSLSGSGSVMFNGATGAGDTVYSQLHVNELSGNMHFFFNTSVEEGRGDYLTIEHGSGHHLVSVADSGREITVYEMASLDLITDASGGADFSLATTNGGQIRAVDGGSYLYYLHSRPGENGEVWYLSTDSSDSARPTTTPAVDAVLALSTAPVLMVNNEMQSLRFRRGNIQQNEGNAGFWMRGIGTRNNVGNGNTHFKLANKGIELGADKIITGEGANTYLGVVTGYNDANVKHARGGTSYVDSYSLGAYLTIMGNNGIYFDGLVKYNYLQNQLRAVSTNQTEIQHDFSQTAVGASIEFGYHAQLWGGSWVEPYGKFSYVQVDGKDIVLNNGMKAKIGHQDSMMTEVGLAIGNQFVVSENLQITPYVKGAWVHEYTASNSIVINDRNRFVTNLSGDVGKVGFGIDANIYNQLTIFAEAGYAKGSKVETPVQGNLGLRLSF